MPSNRQPTRRSPSKALARQVRINGFDARGRHFTPKQIAAIIAITGKYSEEGRTRISERVCRAIRWHQPNGNLKDMACREVLRKLHAIGVIKLPPARGTGAKWPSRIIRAETAVDDSAICDINGNAIRLTRVDSTHDALATVWNSLVEKYHYLHSSRIVGRQIKYIAFVDDRPIACLGWGDAAWAQQARDQWIGWTSAQRTRRRHLIVNNSRFLIFPWVKVPNLASLLIAKCTRQVIADWTDIYSFRPALLETFVDSHLFYGTCYRAANWQDVGITSGYAKVGGSHHNSQTPKLVFVYPTTSSFRSQLRGNRK